MLTDRFDRALQYASDVHREQKRKGTQTPYVSEDEAIAALLHDAAEDQGGAPRLEDIRKRFGSRDPFQKSPWHERKRRYHERLSGHRDGSSCLVSAADKLHNSRAMAQDERQAGEALWRRFSAEKGCILWNLRTLAEIYNAQGDKRVQNVAAELKRVIADLETGTEQPCNGEAH